MIEAGVAIVVVCVILYIWHWLGDVVDELEEYRATAARHARAKAELQEAFRVAQEDLGEEPTVSQLFLTRDQLRMQREQTDGET